MATFGILHWHAEGSKLLEVSQRNLVFLLSQSGEVGGHYIA